MSRRQPAEEGLLFDLPLEEAPGESSPAEEAVQEPLPLTPQEVPPAALPELERRVMAAAPRRVLALRPVPALRQRMLAGLVDLGACTTVLVVLLVALRGMGVRPSAADWPAAVLFFLAFTFLYLVLPLAFWGRTPGMAVVGTRTTSRDGKPLAFRQAVLCWLGSVLTVALAGLPLMMMLGGRSLSERISGSVTRRS